MFLEKLKEFTFLKQNEPESEYYGSIVPKNGKKLILFLDDINLVKK